MTAYDKHRVEVCEWCAKGEARYEFMPGVPSHSPQRIETSANGSAIYQLGPVLCPAPTLSDFSERQAAELVGLRKKLKDDFVAAEACRPIEDAMRAELATLRAQIASAEAERDDWRNSATVQRASKQRNRKMFQEQASLVAYLEAENTALKAASTQQ